MLADLDAACSNLVGCLFASGEAATAEYHIAACTYQGSYRLQSLQAGWLRCLVSCFYCMSRR